MISKEELEDFLNDEISLINIDCKRADKLFVSSFVGIGRIATISKMEKKFGLTLKWPKSWLGSNNFDFENLTKE